MNNDRVVADFKQAIALLRDNNLVWSSDFDDIRLDLADLLTAKIGLGSANYPALIDLVQRLIAEENDLSI
jgi:hypothetical protein